MSDTIWQTLAETPWWIYLIIIFLARLSLAAFKPHVIHIKNLIVSPVIFLGLSLFMMFMNIHFSFFCFTLWSVFILLGIPLGYLQFYVRRIKAANKTQLYVPGTKSLLITILFLIIFIFYFLARTDYFFSLQLFLQAKYTPWLFSFYGLSIGFLIGRLVYSLRCLKVGPFIAENI